MKKTGFAESQIVGVLKEAEKRVCIAGIMRPHGIPGRLISIALSHLLALPAVYQHKPNVKSVTTPLFCYSLLALRRSLTRLQQGNTNLCIMDLHSDNPELRVTSTMTNIS